MVATRSRDSAPNSMNTSWTALLELVLIYRTAYLVNICNIHMHIHIASLPLKIDSYSKT